MTERQFQTSLLKPIEDFTVRDEDFNNRIVIEENIKSRGLIIENCTFQDVVIFDKINLKFGIKFINCNFKKGLAFNDCKTAEYNPDFDSNCHLEFDNTIIEKLYFNGNNRIERGILIHNSTQINIFKVETLFCQYGGLLIKASTINSDFHISHIKLGSDVSIRENSVINAHLRIENVEIDSLVFTESIFTNYVQVWAGKIKSFIFNDGIFNEDVSIKALRISKELTIIGADFKKTLKYDSQDEVGDISGGVSEIYISSGKFGEQFIYNGEDIIDKITIKFSKQLEGAIYFTTVNILETNVSGDNYNGNLVFNHCNFNKLNFSFFYNYSTLSIISAKSFRDNSELIIEHSNMGKTHLFNVFLNSFKKVLISNSILIEIITANIKWFSNINLNPDAPYSFHTFEQKKEIYRQLKIALEKNGNRISSLHFKTSEMRNLKKEFFANKNWLQRIFSIDGIVLLAGQTNDFGQNWLKPVLLAIGFSISLYFLMIVGIAEELSYRPNLTCDSAKKTFQIFYDNSYLFPQFLNPTHTLSRILPDKNFGFIVHALDYILKIGLAFFIFQTVSAFRKYIK